MKLGKMLFNNFWPKVIALVLAVATWFYVFDLVNTDSFLQKTETVEEMLSRFEFTMKEVPVKPVFTGRSPEGYQAVFEKVMVDPSKVALFGPEEILEGVGELRTEPIDVNEYTKSVRLEVKVESDVKALNFKNKTVYVYLPVEPAGRSPGSDKTVETR
jgi:YbbR domain-containing protein